MGMARYTLTEAAIATQSVFRKAIMIARVSARRNSVAREAVGSRNGLAMINAGQRTEVEVMMKQWLARCLAAAALLVSPVAFAAFHLWGIQQIYSSADGTVQFVVLTTAFI